MGSAMDFSFISCLVLWSREYVEALWLCRWCNFQCISGSAVYSLADDFANRLLFMFFRCRDVVASRERVSMNIIMDVQNVKASYDKNG